MSVTVIDAGPIAHADLIRYDDPDIETGLDHGGYGMEGATYRLVEVDLADLDDMRWIPSRPGQFGTAMTEVVRRGEELPPVVIVRTDRDRGFGLIDGLNRLHAHWAAGRDTIRAYELLVG